MALQSHARNDLATTAEPEGLSALLDGECSGADAAGFSRRWRAEPALQQRWDTYHLIGDALRSEDLCRTGPHTDRFMGSLRERLAAEPVVLAPAPLPRRSLRGRWMRPVSAAAGVVAVAGSVWLLPVRQGGPGPLASAPSTVQQPVAATTAAPDRRGRPATEWNRYLAAHQQFPTGAAVMPVSGYLRPADHDTTEH
jgi:sigma-E factor negative regulatory protein RseA